MHSAMPRTGPFYRALLGIAATLTGWAALSHDATAQVGLSIPSRGYFVGVNQLYRGEYRDAERTFDRELRGAIKTTQARWIDSVYYSAMLGEVYYQQGMNSKALEQFNYAAEIFLAYPQWMLRVQFPQLRADPNRTRREAIPWGAPERAINVGHFPDRMSIAQGKFVNENDFNNPGTVTLTPPQYWLVNVQELVRCTCLMIRRRGELLGPLAEYDKTSNDLVAQLRGGITPPNHWSQVWADVQLGLAEATIGRKADANRHLSKSLLAGGQFDHALTGVALLEQGRIALQEGNYQVASRLLAEASYTAFYFDDFGTIDEALALAQRSHLLSQGKSLVAPLNAAAQWAKRNNLRHLQTHFALLAAESLVQNKQPEQAETLLAQAGSRSRRGLSGRLAAYLSYLQARIYFDLGQSKQGLPALQQALTFHANSGLWNYHISLGIQMFDNQQFTENRALDIFGDLLRDPTPHDWSHRPMDSLSVLTLPHTGAFDRWFGAALSTGEHEAAVAAADQMHRRRFFGSLPFGGRLLALSHILPAPAGELPQEAALVQKELLADYPRYQELLTDVRQLERTLAASSLEPADDAARRELQQNLKALGRASDVQQQILQRMGVSRRPTPMLLPPQMPTVEMQKKLSEGQVVVVFHEAADRLYGFAFTKGNYASWQIGPVAEVQRQLSELLREFGNFDASREIPYRTLRDSQWRKAGFGLYAALFGGAEIDFSKVQELVIVPDHVTWYVPFQGLVASDDAQAQPLGITTAIRYVPFVALAPADARPHRRVHQTGILVGEFFPRAETGLAEEEFQRLSEAIPSATRLPQELPGTPAQVAAMLDQLIVLNDIAKTGSGPYQWTPISVKRRRSGGSLADWMRSVAPGPERMLLPGFETAAATSLRGKVPDQRPGDELFFAVSGLMATGTRTALLSRWKTGGKSAVDLVREFAQELPYTTASSAWQRSTLLVRDTPLDVSQEPRLGKIDEGTDPPTAEHPFFWSGYLLFDTGGEHLKDD